MSNILIITHCGLCTQESSVTVNEFDYWLYKSGFLLIQEAFPHHTPSEREAIMTGTCDECWSSLVPDEEDDWESVDPASQGYEHIS